jgi:hypothetical protein
LVKRVPLVLFEKRGKNPTRTRDATFGEARARSETTTKVFVHVLVACLPPFQRSHALTTRSRGEMFARSRAATRAPPRAVGDDERRRRRRRRRERRAMPRRRATGVRFAPRERDYPPHPTRASASAVADASRARRRRVPSRAIDPRRRARAFRPPSRALSSIDRSLSSIDRGPFGADRPSPIAIGRFTAARLWREDDRAPRASNPRTVRVRNPVCVCACVTVGAPDACPCPWS